MTSIGCHEARTHFTKLLGQIANGKTILITRHGKPAALLTPPPGREITNVKQTIKDMKTLRQGNLLGADITIRELMEEGRA